MAPPDTMHWLFWDIDLAELEVERHAEYILSRVLERGRIDDVRWALRTYGEARIHAFLRERPRAELSPRTLAFWRAFFREEKPWPTGPSSCPTTSAPVADSAEGIDAAWRDELVRRARRVESGESVLLDGNEVYQRLRAKYDR